MIPLAQWLRQGAASRMTEQVEATTPLLVLQPEAIAASQEREAGISSPVVTELEGALAEALRQLEQAGADSLAREQDLTERLGLMAVQRLSEEMKAGLVTLQRAIEDAVVDVLLPFLGAAACRRASDDLLALVRQAIDDMAEPVVELRVPGPLLDACRQTIEAASLPACLAEGDEIELVFADRSLRFEELSRQWRALLLDSQS